MAQVTFEYFGGPFDGCTEVIDRAVIEAKDVGVPMRCADVFCRIAKDCVFIHHYTSDKVVGQDVADTEPIRHESVTVKAQ